MDASIGEIWLVTIPLLEIENNGDISVKLQKKPCLIIDDGRGLIVEEDNRNFHVLKLTTQYDRYKRKLIKDWKELGLKKKSYIRIEIPIKIEKMQFERKVGKISDKMLLDIYKEVYNILNITALEKMAKKSEEGQPV